MRNARQDESQAGIKIARRNINSFRYADDTILVTESKEELKSLWVYGGTFNPLHTGHIHAVRQAMETLRLDKLLMIPDRIAPHKEIPSGSPTPEQRLQMLQLAVAGEPGIEVSDIELKREGPSYTYLTVETLRETYPDAKLYLIMGTDIAPAR